MRFAENAAAAAAKKKEGAAARQDKTRFLTNFVEEETFLMDKSFVFKPNKSVEQRWIQLLLPPQDIHPGAFFYRIFREGGNRSHKVASIHKYCRK